MSDLTETLLYQIHVAGLLEPEREYRFAPPRRWRFDLAWEGIKLAVECDGGTWSSGRHTRGAGFAKDCEKLNAAARAGWCVLRYTSEMINDGSALNEIEAEIEVRIGRNI